MSNDTLGRVQPCGGVAKEAFNTLRLSGMDCGLAAESELKRRGIPIAAGVTI